MGNGCCSSAKPTKPIGTAGEFEPLLALLDVQKQYYRSLAANHADISTAVSRRNNSTGTAPPQQLGQRSEIRSPHEPLLDDSGLMEGNL